MKLCAVQLASLKGDVQANLERHLACIEQAAALGAELVVFPELSLTGYEPTLARQAALPVSSTRLDPLQAACDRLGITVAAGLPLPTPDGIRIGQSSAAVHRARPMPSGACMMMNCPGSPQAIKPCCCR